jgi:hypothetical protein
MASASRFGFAGLFLFSEVARRKECTTSRARVKPGTLARLHRPGDVCTQGEEPGFLAASPTLKQLGAGSR